MKPTLTLRVIYGDTDQMGVVYYANYLRYFEASRAEWLRSKSYDYRRFEQAGLFLPVIEAHVRYKSAARYDDLLEIYATPHSTAATVRFEYAIKRQGNADLIAEGHTVHACITREGRPRRIPEELKALVAVPSSP